MYASITGFSTLRFMSRNPPFVRSAPQPSDPKDTLVETQHKIKQIEADEQTHVRSQVLSLAILLVPLHFPLSLYSKGRLVNF